MYEDFTAVREPVTPEYVLAILRDSHRQQCQYDPEADADVSLSFDTTVAEWRQACDLLPWRQLADAYNDWLGFHCSHEEWRAALTPSKQRTLRDVCNLLARHAKLPQTRSVILLGSSCVSGGTFLTIRSLLRDAGADVRDIAPSTPLASYARRHWDVFLGPISWLAPGALPPITIHNRIDELSMWGMLLGLVSLVVGACTSLPWATILGVLVLVASYSLNWFAVRWLGPSRVEFGQLKAFRDLATVIARHVPV